MLCWSLAAMIPRSKAKLGGKGCILGKLFLSLLGQKTHEGLLRSPGNKFLSQRVAPANLRKGRDAVGLSRVPACPGSASQCGDRGRSGCVRGLLRALLFTHFSQSLVRPGGSAAAPQMLFIFSCERLVTVQGVVYPVRLFIAQPVPGRRSLLAGTSRPQRPAT